MLEVKYFTELLSEQERFFRVIDRRIAKLIKRESNLNIKLLLLQRSKLIERNPKFEQQRKRL